MKPTLYLEKNLFTEDELQDTSKIISEYFNIHEINMNAIIGGRINLNRVQFGRFSLNIAKFIKRDYSFSNCLKWVPAFREYTLSPRNTYFNDISYFINCYNYFDFPIFLRPCDGFKSFAGQVFPNKERLIEEFNFMTKNKNLDPYTMCMTSSIKKIDREWRTIFVNNEYCSGSQYLVNDELQLSSAIPSKVIKFATKIGKNSYFDNIFNYCVDICESDGKLHLLEINSFESSSFYAADLNKIYSAWSKFYDD